MRSKFFVQLAWLIGTLSLPLPTYAAEVSIAVAANFSAPLRTIAQDFEQQTGHKTVLTFGATGQFYAQIRNGAPFAILLAADEETPAKIEKEGLGLAGTRFTYAIGRLVLWSRTPGLVDDKGEILRSSKFDKLAIANPRLAPYGAAALQVLDQLGLRSAIAPKIVEGSNISQAYQFVSSENATLGFIALSQVFAGGKIKEGSGWIVPAHMHKAIKQDAIMLNRARGNPAADAFMKHLRSERAKKVMRSYGYELPEHGQHR